MKIILDNILNNIKVLTGRKLSQEDIENAKKRNSQYFFGITDVNKSIDLFVDGDEIIRAEIKEKIPFKNSGIWEWQITDLRHYNLDGLLIQKYIEKRTIYSNKQKDKTIIYNPPGRFIGTREKIRGQK